MPLLVEPSFGKKELCRLARSNTTHQQLLAAGLKVRATGQVPEQKSLQVLAHQSRLDGVPGGRRRVKSPHVGAKPIAALKATPEVDTEVDIRSV